MAGKIGKHITRFTLVLLLVVLIVLPLLLLIIQWLTSTDKATLLSFISQDTLLLIGKSVLLSSLVALLATVIGAICALLLYKFKLSFSGFYKVVLLLPLFISPYIFAVAWRDGFYWLFGSTAAFYSVAGVILVHTLVFFPLTMLIIGSSLTQIHAGYEEAGFMIVSFRRMLLKILFPLIRPALTISFLLVMIFSLSDFSVPAFFAVKTFTTEVFTQFSAFYNYQLAIGQSILLLILCLLLMLAEVRYLSDAPFFSVEVRGSISKKYKAGKQQLIFHAILLIILFTALLLPVFMLVYQCFSGRMLFFGKAWELISSAAFQSVKVAFAGASLITAIGLWAAYIQERRQFKIPNLLLLLTFIVPSTVLGIAFIRYYNISSLNFIYGTVFILLITYLSRFGFIASRIIGNGVKQVPVSFEEAAVVMGISPTTRFFKITLPLLIPSLFATFVLSFVLCLGELGTAIMVYPPGTELMPIKIFTISANAPQALTSSMTLINLGVVLIFILVFFFIGKILFKKFQYA